MFSFFKTEKKANASTHIPTTINTYSVESMADTTNLTTLKSKPSTNFDEIMASDPHLQMPVDKKVGKISSMQSLRSMLSGKGKLSPKGKEVLTNHSSSNQTSRPWNSSNKIPPAPSLQPRPHVSEPRLSTSGIENRSQIPRWVNQSRESPIINPLIDLGPMVTHRELQMERERYPTPEPTHPRLHLPFLSPGRPGPAPAQRPIQRPTAQNPILLQHMRAYPTPPLLNTSTGRSSPYGQPNRIPQRNQRPQHTVPNPAWISPSLNPPTGRSSHYPPTNRIPLRTQRLQESAPRPATAPSSQPPILPKPQRSMTPNQARQRQSVVRNIPSSTRRPKQIPLKGSMEGSSKTDGISDSLSSGLTSPPRPNIHVTAEPATITASSPHVTFAPNVGRPKGESASAIKSIDQVMFEEFKVPPLDIAKQDATAPSIQPASSSDLDAKRKSTQTFKSWSSSVPPSDSDDSRLNDETEALRKANVQILALKARLEEVEGKLASEQEVSSLLRVQNDNLQSDAIFVSWDQTKKDKLTDELTAEAEKTIRMLSGELATSRKKLEDSEGTIRTLGEELAASVKKLWDADLLNISLRTEMASSEANKVKSQDSNTQLQQEIDRLQEELAEERRRWQMFPVNDSLQQQLSEEKQRRELQGEQHELFVERIEASNAKLLAQHNKESAKISRLLADNHSLQTELEDMKSNVHETICSLITEKKKFATRLEDTELALEEAQLGLQNVQIRLHSLEKENLALEAKIPHWTLYKLESEEKISGLQEELKTFRSTVQALNTDSHLSLPVCGPDCQASREELASLKPLIAIAVAARRSFLEEAFAKANIYDPKGNKDFKADQLIINRGFDAAHDPNISADLALFRVRIYEAQSEEADLFKSVYGRSWQTADKDLTGNEIPIHRLNRRAIERIGSRLKGKIDWCSRWEKVRNDLERMATLEKKIEKTMQAVRGNIERLPPPEEAPDIRHNAFQDLLELQVATRRLIALASTGMR